MDPSTQADAKQALRRELIAARTARSAGERARAAASNADHLYRVLGGTEVVCGYLPLASEPLDVLVLDRMAAGGTTVLVPVVSANAPLDWCRHPSPTVRGAFGIAEPAGPRLGVEAIADASVVLVPALAVDRLGHRLGRGGGHYDRSLALIRSPAVELIAIVFDEEVLAEVPVDPHDRAVTSVVTPAGGLEHLPR